MLTTRRYLTAKQVAEQLEMALNTVYLERAAGRLVGEPHGSRSWRFTQEAVDAYRQSKSPARAVPHALDAHTLAAMFRRMADEIEGVTR